MGDWKTCRVKITVFLYRTVSLGQVREHCRIIFDKTD